MSERGYTIAAGLLCLCIALLYLAAAVWTARAYGLGAAKQEIGLAVVYVSVAIGILGWGR